MHPEETISIYRGAGNAWKFRGNLLYYTVTRGELFALNCHSEGAAFYAVTEESPPQIHLAIGINWFLAFIFSLCHMLV